MLRDRYKTCGGGVLELDEESRRHVAAHPEVDDALMAEAMRLIALPKEGRLTIELDFGRIIGLSGCVKTLPVMPETPTTFARRGNRAGPSRVLVGGSKIPTSKLVIKANPTSVPRVYRLFTAFVGDRASAEPWNTELGTPEAREKSLRFWCSHALVYNQDVMGEVFTSSWIQVLKNFAG